MRTNLILFTFIVSGFCIFMMGLDFIIGRRDAIPVIAVLLLVYDSLFFAQLLNPAYKVFAVWLFGTLAAAMSAFLADLGPAGGTGVSVDIYRAPYCGDGGVPRPECRI